MSALTIFKESYPDWVPSKLIEMDDKWIIIAKPKQPGKRATMDPFFKVDKKTGVASEYAMHKERALFLSKMDTAIDVSPIQHHGIKGMHWGERRWQDEQGKWTPAGRIRYGKGGSQRSNVDDLKILNREGDVRPIYSTRNDYIYNREVAKYRGKFVEPALIVGANPEAYKTGKPGITPKKLKAVNPDYGIQTGTTMNCQKCSITLELMNRGYEGIKAGRSADGVDDYAVADCFMGAISSDCSKSGAAKLLKSFGPNASGIFSAYYTFDENAGHAVYFHNDKNGEPTFYDSQDGRTIVHGLNAVYKEYSYDPGDDRTTITRLDNCDIDWQQMSEYGMIRFDDGNSYVKNMRTKEVTDFYSSGEGWITDSKKANKQVSTDKLLSAWDNLDVSIDKTIKDTSLKDLQNDLYWELYDKNISKSQYNKLARMLSNGASVDAVADVLSTYIK